MKMHLLVALQGGDGQLNCAAECNLVKVRRY